MITYDADKWAGFHKLIQMHGSVAPTVLPRCLASVLLCIPVHYLDWIYFPRSPYAHQIFTFGLSFLVIMRTNLSYSRYWEGISELVAMHSKWTDAISQVIAFDELATGPAATCGTKFRGYISHLFSVMSACIVLKLQEGGIEEFAEQTCRAVPRHSPATQPNIAPSTFASVVPAAQSAKQDEGIVEDSEEEEGEPQFLQLIDGLLPGELDELLKAEDEGCVVHHCMQKVVRLVAVRHKQGGLAAPPPIVSRIFQELSNGLLAYQNANKVASIPFPFPYAQIVQYLQLAFVLSAPFVVVAFVDDLGFQMFFTFLAVFTFCSLNAVASELEDPFGHDANDLPLRSLHRNFVYVLIQLTNSKLTKTDLMSVTPEEQQTLVSEPSPEDHPEAKALDNAAASLVDKMNQQVSASGGTVLHAEALREMFNSLDKNGNAVLDHDELRTLCERLGLGFSDDKFGHMMKKLDPDGTGEVSFNDFLKWFMKKHRKQALKAKNITSTNNT